MTTRRVVARRSTAVAEQTVEGERRTTSDLKATVSGQRHATRKRYVARSDNEQTNHPSPIRLMQRFLRWLHRTFGRPSPLAEINMLPLGTTLDDAIGLYGDPSEAYIDDDVPDAMGFRFRDGLVPEIVAWQWKDKIQAVVYHSDGSNPGRDLAAMMDMYGDGQKWNGVNQGYLYFRADNRLRLTCSAVPIYAVGTAEFFTEKYKRKETDD